MSEQKNINCRVCLRYDLEISQKCLSLFEKYNNSLIAEKIKYVANIEINESDGLPSKICPECLLQLETAILFKQKCETSNKILLSVVQQPSKAFQIPIGVPVKEEVDEDSSTETEILKLEITKDELAKVENTTNQHDNKKPADRGSHIEKHASKASQMEKPGATWKNKELVNFLPVHVIPKTEEPEYEISDNDELLIETKEKHKIERLLNLQSKETEKTVEGKPSRAIDSKLICDDCGVSFKSKCKISVHWKKVHLPTKLVCENCKRMFKSYKAMHIHLKKKTRSCQTASCVRIEGMGKKRVFHCKDCEYSTKRVKDMDAHLVIHSGVRRFQCKDCLKCFTQHASLQGHRESKHKDYRIITTCHICGKVINGRNRFYKHVLQHKPKSVQCEVCKKMLKSKATLSNHMKRHAGVKTFICETCSANFFTRGELCNHRKKVHFKKKIFKCDLCEYTAYTAGLLRTHKSRHTHSNVACLICGMFLENAEKLAIHQKRHADKNFSCTDCDKSFFRRDSLRRHIIKKHGEPKKLENFVITLNPILS